MKKSRPGIMLSVVCVPEDADNLAQLILRHTTTLGVRRQDLSRYVMARKVESQETPFGLIRVKHSEGFGVSKCKAEYEDVAKAARENNLSIREVLQVIENT